VHLCNYCDFYKKEDGANRIDLTPFHQGLNNEMELHTQLINKYGFTWGKLKTLYFGGGTPSLWGREGAEFFQSFLEQNQLHFESEYEWTMEVNPDSCETNVLKAWKELGVNRFSLGAQALDNKYLKDLDRAHDKTQTLKALELMAESNENYSMDFMLGLPNSEQRGRDIIGELELALKFNPSHFSVYILTTKNTYLHQNSLPSQEWVEKEYLEVAEFLKDKGFEHYEVSNFSLPKKQSQHNLRYWEAKSVGALGASATGFLNLGKTGLRYKWQTKGLGYKLEELDEQALNLEKLYLGLRTSKGVTPEDFFKGEELKKVKTLYSDWVTQGLADSSSFRLNSKGYLLMDFFLDQIFTASTSST